MTHKEDLEKPEDILSYLKEEKSEEVEKSSDYTGLDNNEVREILSILKKMGLLKDSRDLTPFSLNLLGFADQKEEE